MRSVFSIVVSVSAIFCFSGAASGQVDEMCREFGAIPSLDSPFAQTPYVYGKISLKGLDAGAKFPKVSVALVRAEQSRNRINVEPSGNFCFRGSGGGGTLLVEVNGVEVARRQLPPIGPAQQREDFEIHMSPGKPASPAVVSAKFSHPKNEKTTELYKQAAEAIAAQDRNQTIAYLKQIVAADPADFIAWAQLGSMHAEQLSFADADAAFRRSLELKPEYTPAWINVGKLRVAQKQLEAAIEIFKHAVSLEPESARVHQLLGETYIQAKQGTLGVESMREAIRLDPVGMAGSHLMIGRLYELAGAKGMATKEYKAFLAKVPDYQDRKKLEKFIKDNPE
jgi:cytochrome c-type biogenesis protein CcmH/NrfG